MPETTLFIILLAVVSFGFILDKTLDLLNIRSLLWPVPDMLSDLYDADEYQKSQDYNRVKVKVSSIQSSISFAAILLMFLLHGFAWLDGFARTTSDSPIWQAVVFFGIIGLASSVLSLPFSLYNTFVVEEKFGFNRTNLRTFLLDLLKSSLLAVIIGGGLIILIVWIYEASGNWFWLLVWGVITVFSLAMTLLYSDLIVPLFNKQKPLEEGELRTAINSYAKGVNFSLKDIYVIDGSKRSNKANAYFTGFGPRRRIVLYDTLIEEHSIEELVAILAHEAGHYKKKHVMKGMLISITQTGLLLYILSLFIAKDSNTASLLASSIGALPSFHIGVFVFGILYSPISSITSLLMNVFSRKNEYEADRYAAETYSSKELSSALKHLSVKHLSNLTPHPVYVAFNYSHPPLYQRLKAMQELD